MTTTTGDADDSPQELQPSFVDWVKDWFRADGRLSRAVQDIEDILPKLRTLSQRGPDPDAPYPPDQDVDKIVRFAAREAARAAIEIGTYNEGGGGNKKENSSWQNWILGIAGTVISLGIGAILVQLSDLKAQAAAIVAKQDTTIEATNRRLEADERRIETLERRVFSQ